MNKQKAIIIGASSGMGKALAIQLSGSGYDVGLCARRLSLLEELKQQLPNRSYIREMDVTRPESAAAVLENLINEVGGLSKAYVSNFLQGLRYRATRHKKNISITTIEPGFVDTAMAKGDGLFWVASPEKAAKQIFGAIKGKRKHAYVTRKWRLMAWLMKILPDTIYSKI